MKLKVADLYDLSLGLGDLADKDLPISTSFKIQRNQKKVSEELLASNKVREKIIKDHTKEKLDDGLVQLTDKGKEKMNELMQQDVELALQTINLSELEGISIKPRSLSFLEKILVEENAK